MVSLSDPAVQSYALYSTILALKVLSMAFLTARARFSKKVFANEEDAVATTKGKVKYDDPDVERVRRAHRNDLENIPAFWILGALYLTTGPAASTAANLFRAYTAGRLIHTFVYAIKPMPQPARGIAFGVPLFIMIFMGFKVITFYASAL
ncbi:microsomal glutathione S-transferase 1 [Plodia interpunctella]|uniref:microsomal glutathione S-transferase 1 n=1 Tax=Plodia interpunctella TaxID=58824 RepID=UPI002367F4EE|nr:microsomal glutathione S-transferase 1 [Plodia interpunctella]